MPIKIEIGAGAIIADAFSWIRRALLKSYENLCEIKKEGLTQTTTTAQMEGDSTVAKYNSEAQDLDIQAYTQKMGVLTSVATEGAAVGAGGLKNSKINDLKEQQELNLKYLNDEGLKPAVTAAKDNPQHEQPMPTDNADKILKRDPQAFHRDYQGYSKWKFWRKAPNPTKEMAEAEIKYDIASVQDRAAFKKTLEKSHSNFDRKIEAEQRTRDHLITSGGRWSQMTQSLVQSSGEERQAEQRRETGEHDKDTQLYQQLVSSMQQIASTANEGAQATQQAYTQLGQSEDAVWNNNYSYRG